ncbi:fructokinase [Abditibacteriota bacterium]|nr:fructokinase [Abditibacteriota bacterium]
MRVTSFGELLIDMVSPTPDAALGEATQFLKAPGGAPANVAVGVKRLGIDAAFVGSVGDDPFGHFLRDMVGNEGVDVSGVKLSRNRTTIAFIATRTDGSKDIAFYRNPGADADFAEEDLPDLHSTSIFHCGSVSLSLEPCRSAQLEAARRIKANGGTVSFDPNWRPSLWDDFDLAHEQIWQMMELADVVKVADEEWEFVTGTDSFKEGARKIRAAGPQLVLQTRGANGAAWEFEGGMGEVSGLTVKAIDTLGAGDAFVAGFLSEIARAGSLAAVLKKEELNAMLRFANACGAITTQKAGAIPALPSREEVEAFLQRTS